ncbi:MAG TPA: LysR family transcriptional regulator [Gaiellaceae bacterium]|nr:LysR family transcriptional regulator [Gaiellaceae bacterium]
MLDPRRLALLREVVRHGSFSRAARALFLTQPAVSRQVAKLEQEAGVRLLERTPTGLRLTDAGRVAVERAEAIAGHLAAAEAELEAIAALGAGRLRLCAFPTAASTLVLEAIRMFRRRHPGVELSFLEAGTRAGVQRLRGGDVDLALAFRERGQPPPTSWEGLQAEHLLVDPLYVALAKDHRLAGRDAIRLRDLRDEAWVQAVQAGPSGITYRACLAAGFEPRVVHLSDHAPITQGLVAAGMGVTLISSLSVPQARKDIAIRPLKPSGPRRDVFAVSLPGALRPPAITAMVEILRELAPRYEPARRSAAVRPSSVAAP